MKRSIFTHWKTWAAGAALSAAALLAGCGGSTQTGDASGSGQVIVGLTDAAGDFVRYEVDVVSLELTRANGTVVETLPMETRIDFADLTEVTEFVTAATVPNGAYTAGRLNLDYSDADIQVEDATGDVVSATAADANGDPLTTLGVEVQLSNAHHLVVAPGVPAHLTLDFDLAATNRVNLDVSPPEVTVDPLLVAEVNPERPKPHRVRGPLVSVDETDASFTLAIRPHWWRVRDLGRLRVETSAETAFEVDGETARGSDGFTLLAAKVSGTAVVAVGDLDLASRTFVATEVYAGSSVPGGTLDVLGGVVTARSGDTITVRGGALEREHGALYLHQDVTVDLSGGPTVTRQGDPDGTHDASEISVGQHVKVFGAFATADAPMMTATHVRLLVTHIAGTVTAKTEGDGILDGELRLALQHIHGRRPEAFDFSGTGTDPDHDADPLDYAVDTGVLGLSHVSVADPVRVWGFVTPFGTAEPDFEAVTVADASEATARLRVLWTDPGVDAVTVGADALTLGLSGAGALHHVFRNGIATELAPEPAPTVVPENADRGLFALKRRGMGPTAVYTVYADFADALQSSLDSGAQVDYLSGLGAFDTATQTFTARKITVVVR